MFESATEDPSDFFEKATRPHATPDDRAAFIEMGDQKIQVRFLQDRSEVMCSALVYFNEHWLLSFNPLVVAKFNATHLFSGGCCLAVEPTHGAVDINQTINADGLDEQRFVDWIDSFAAQAAHAIAWFYGEHAKMLEEANAMEAVRH